MKKMSISLVSGFAAVLVTILLYVVLLSDELLEAICLITLLGVVLAEVIVTALAYLSKGEPRKVAAAGVSALLIPYAIWLSVVYIANFPYGYGKYLAWYLVGLLVIGTICAILFGFGAQKKEADTALQGAKQHMLGLRNLVKCVMATPASAPYQKELAAIEEKLHFTNDSVVAPQDAMIENLLTNLLNQIADPNADIPALLTQIHQTIDIRTITTKYSV